MSPPFFSHSFIQPGSQSGCLQLMLAPDGMSGFRRNCFTKMGDFRSLAGLND
jgi:hypothetical protein